MIQIPSSVYVRLTRLSPLLALLMSLTAQADLKFTPLGDLPGGTVNSVSKAISADGTTIVGYSSSTNGSGGEAFRWTEANGMEALGDLPGGSFFSQALGVSADGSVVVGSGINASSYNGGWRWTAATGLTAIPDLTGGIDNGMVYGVSSDGVTVVGTGSGAGNTNSGYLWTAAGGHVLIPGFVAGNASYTNAISADGTTAVGEANRTNGIGGALRWTAAGGAQDLGSFPGGDRSTAVAVSADGSVVVGNAYVAGTGNRHAFRWTAATGIVDLGLLHATGGFRSEALACSADGSVVVGISEATTIGDSAFIWDAVNGMRSIKTLVQAAGFAKRWTQFTMATGVSADGTKITGYGVNGQGNTEAFLLDLNAPPPPPPPPATGGLVWCEDLPQTEAFKANSVVRLAYDNGTGVTDIATLNGASAGGWGGVEYAGGYLLIPSTATVGTGTRTFDARYAPIMVTNLYAYDYDFTPGYLWAVNGNNRQVIRYVPNGGFLSTNGSVDRNWLSSRTRSASRFTNAVQVVGNVVYFSSSVTDPIGIYKMDTALLTSPVAVFTQSGLGSPAIYDFEVVGDYIYFGDINNNAIRRVKTDGTEVTTLVSGANFPNSIEVTDTYIYWTEMQTQLIRRANLDGTGVVTIRELDNTPRGIAVVPLSLIDGPAPQAVTVSGLVTNYTSAINTPITLTPSATSGLPVTLEIVSGPATVSGHTITYTGAGAVVLRASQAGDANYAPASFDYYITANPRLAQTITFDPLPTLAYTGTPLTFTPSATASSGLAVSFFVVSGPATRDSTTGVITVSGAGTVTVRASQSGDSTYAPATFIERTFTVTDGADALTAFLVAAGVPSNALGSLDDPDHDGLGNLVEFALGLSPTTADANAAAAPLVVLNGNSLTLTYRRAAVSGLTFEVETTTDLTNPASWTTTGVEQGTPDSNGVTTASAPLDGAVRYLRLKVSYTPTP